MAPPRERERVERDREKSVPESENLPTVTRKLRYTHTRNPEHCDTPGHTLSFPSTPFLPSVRPIHSTTTHNVKGWADVFKSGHAEVSRRRTKSKDAEAACC